MEEFLSLAQTQLGLSPSDSATSTSALLGVLKDKMPSGDFGDLAAKIPGLLELADGNSGPSSDSGGLLGGLAASASSLMGGNGSSLDIIQKLAASGLSLDNAGSFIGLFTQFVRDKAGDGLLSKVLSSVPEIKSFLD